MHQQSSCGSFFALRFRSLFFFRYSNPAIPNGGLYGDSKAVIYGLLPPGTYPKTILIDPGAEYDFHKILQEHHLHFPLIVKPDVGCRGVHVQLVRSMEELWQYKKEIGKKFLIQEFCDYPHEVGLFYCRLPGEKRGRITGLTCKHFLTVTGNGRDTIETLLHNDPRHMMQIPRLKHKVNLKEILPEGRQLCLVPFGNHNRGTQFTDGRSVITDRLEDTFYALLAPMEGFYYGRLDIRFQSFADLEEGRNFSIIEVNGAKSEPTHIYDPGHTFWYGQREIFRHQMIFQSIIAQLQKGKLPVV
jgi:hypothetical protein